MTIFVGLIVLNVEPLNRTLWPDLVDTIVGVTGILIGLVGLLQVFRGGGGWGAGLLGALSLGFGVYVLVNEIVPSGILVRIIGVVAVLGGLFSIILAVRIFRADPEKRIDLSKRNPLIGDLPHPGHLDCHARSASQRSSWPGCCPFAGRASAFTTG